jgi:hypothetical protein
MSKFGRAWFHSLKPTATFGAGCSIIPACHRKFRTLSLFRSCQDFRARYTARIQHVTLARFPVEGVPFSELVGTFHMVEMGSLRMFTTLLLTDLWQSATTLLSTERASANSKWELCVLWYRVYSRRNDLSPPLTQLLFLSPANCHPRVRIACAIQDAAKTDATVPSSAMVRSPLAKAVAAVPSSLISIRPFASSS